jgi:flagellar M-ring protein FliF
MSFAQVDEKPSMWSAEWWEASWIEPLARNIGGLLLGALVILVGLPFLRRRGLVPAIIPTAAKATANPANAEAAKIAASMEKELAAALSQRPRPDPVDVTLNMIEAAPSYEARAVLIRNFVRENPARAALVIRDLLRNGKNEGVSKVG